MTREEALKIIKGLRKDAAHMHKLHVKWTKEAVDASKRVGSNAPKVTKDYVHYQRAIDTKRVVEALDKIISYLTK